MLIDLRGIIDVPGGRAPFQYEADLSDAAFGSVVRIEKPARAVGDVVNRAGVLTFSADVDAVCVCVCARCLKEFELAVRQRITANLNEEGMDGGDPDGYGLLGDAADADEIIRTEFILHLDQRLMCREDCAGLCERCGADLADGPCLCAAGVDSRFAVLGQLLEGKEGEEVF